MKKRNAEHYSFAYRTFKVAYDIIRSMCVVVYLVKGCSVKLAA